MTSKILTVTGQSATLGEWNDPTYISHNDLAFTWASLAVTPGNTGYLYAKIDASQLPVGATLEGIQVIIKKVATLNRCRDYSVEFINNMVLVSEDKKNPLDWPWDGVSWRYDTYGDSTDMWATSLTGNDINTGNVWLQIRCERYGGFVTPVFRIDYIEITAYYSGGGTITINPYGPDAQVI